MGRLPRLLPLPKGVNRELYDAAMVNIPLADRPTAWSLMREHGQGMAEALSAHGPRVLALTKDHGNTAALAFATHKDTLALFEVHGPIVFPVLSKLKPELRGRVGSLSTAAANNRVFNLYQAFLRAPRETRTLLLSTPEERLDARLVEIVQSPGRRTHR